MKRDGGSAAGWLLDVGVGKMEEGLSVGRGGRGGGGGGVAGGNERVECGVGGVVGGGGGGR